MVGVAKYYLREVFPLLKAALLAFLITLFVLTVFLFLRQNIYVSSAWLVPTKEAQGAGLSGLANKFGGLASIAGIDLGDSGTSKVDYAIQRMQAKSFALPIIEELGWKEELFAAYSWDSESTEIIYDSDVFDSQENKWVRKVKPPRRAEPSLQEVFDEGYIKRLSVKKDQNSGFVKISFSHPSPVFASEVVFELVSRINQDVRDKEITDARSKLEYLNEQVENVASTELRSMFYQLIQEQHQTIMLADSKQDYVFEYVDQPFVPELHDQPQRIIYLIMNVLASFIVAALVFLTQHGREGIYMLVKPFVSWRVDV